MSPDTILFLKNSWEVFLLFAVPIGGGIPAGVLLAKSRGLSWITMSILYFFSDVALACVFEPLMLYFIRKSRENPKMNRVKDAFKQNMNKTVARYGVNPGPFVLILIAFGVDPMTGRLTARAAGHQFLTGWAIAIAGDMLFFGVVMASTIWLNNLLGDGTWTAIIIMVAMIGIPALIKRFREANQAA